MKRVFICTEFFERCLRTRENFDLIQELIEARLTQNLECGDIIPGTGGVRKFRLEDIERNKGKRGGLRIIYIDFPHVDCTYFLFIYDKGEFDNISPEDKKIIKLIVERLKKENL